MTSRQKKNPDAVQPHEFSDLVEGIEAALVRFDSTSNHAVLRLYRRSDANSPILSMTSLNQTTATHALSKQANDTDHESVFLVYLYVIPKLLSRKIADVTHLASSLRCKNLPKSSCSSWTLSKGSTVMNNMYYTDSHGGPGY